MAVYNYTVVDKKGEKLEGRHEAETRSELITFLLDKGYTIVSLHEELNLSLSSILDFQIGGISISDKVILSKQLATMIGAGIPLLQAVDIIRQQADKSYFKRKFDALYKKIESGIQFSKAIQEIGGLYSPTQIRLLEAGEKSGNLNLMLAKVADDLEREKKFKAQVRSALIYPSIVLAVFLIVLGLIFYFMVPQISQLYRISLDDQQIPFFTDVLLKMGDLVTKPGFFVALFGLFILITWGYLYAIKNLRFKKNLDELKLKLPFTGKIISKNQLAEFCRITSMMIKSDVPIVEAISVTSSALSNSVYSTILKNAAENVSQGATLSAAIAKVNKDGAFPLVLIRVIASGEEAGRLAETLEEMVNFYQSEVDQSLENITKIIEPVFLIAFGLLITFLTIAIYLPVLQLTNQV